LHNAVIHVKLLLSHDVTHKLFSITFSTATITNTVTIIMHKLYRVVQ